MTRSNTPVFIDGTDRNDIVHFKDYEANPKKVKSELKKMKRSAFPKNDDRIGPTVAKKRYNNVTHNYEDQFPAEVDDKIKAMDEYEKESEVVKFNEYKPINESISLPHDFGKKAMKYQELHHRDQGYTLAEAFTAGAKYMRDYIDETYNKISKYQSS